MPFLGKSPTAGFASIVKDDLTPNGSTTAFTLSKQVANANDIAVFLGNVRQEPTDAYTVSGTTLTMSAAPASGLNFYVLHIAGTLESSVIPADGTITNAKIVGMASSKLTGAMPALNGSALTNVTGASLVKLSTVTVASGSATDYAFNFTNVFSDTYDDYFFNFNIQTNETSHNGNAMYAQFGNGGTYVTSGNACRGAQMYNQVTSAAVGKQYYYSTTGIHQVLGTLIGSENGIFAGTGVIKNVRESARPTSIVIPQAIMQYTSNESNTYFENGGSREDNGDQGAYTDVRFGVIIGAAAGSDVTNSADRRNVFGQVTIYGIVK